VQKQSDFLLQKQNDFLLLFSTKAECMTAFQQKRGVTPFLAQKWSDSALYHKRVVTLLFNTKVELFHSSAQI